MHIKKKLNNLNFLYIIFFSLVLFINIIFSTSLKANSFKITDLEISEPFELNFDKEKVIDKGFKTAFIELISMITTSGDKQKVINTPLDTIKRLIDSFTMGNESFVQNQYRVNFDVNFNKKNTLNFFEKKNIFPSIPQKKNILLIPIFVDLKSDNIFLFSDNIFYKNWNIQNERYFLLNYLLPNEDLEDVNLINQNSDSIEEYDFKKIIEKYDLQDFIITIIYSNDDELKILSKIKLNNSLKIHNKRFNKINLNNKDDLNIVLYELKNTYENYWKSLNEINTSMKISLNIQIDAKENDKIKSFEEILGKIDLISNYEIFKFNNYKIDYKIIYFGTPDKFLNDMKEKGLLIDSKKQIWTIE